MNEPENKSTFWSQFVIWTWRVCLCTFVVAVLVIVIPNFIKPRYSPPRNACVDNLRQIDGAISEWALEKGKTNGTVVVESEIKDYLKLDAAGNFPVCPKGGTYKLGKVGDIPQVSCSLGTTVKPAHVVP